MKYAITYVISGLYMRANQRKPFNPLLGETLEGEFSDGTKIHMEHISHHPPISNYYIEGPRRAGYKLYGVNEFVGNIKSAGNILNVQFKGTNTIEFPDGQKIVYYNPCNKVTGLMRGDKLIFMEGVLEMVDEENKLKACVLMEPKSKEIMNSDNPNYFEGSLYYYKGKGNTKAPERLSAIGDIDEEICTIHGSWLDNLYIDDEEVWNIDNTKPSRVIFPKHCLPSDHRYREDLIWLFYENENYAQEWKQLLEVQQRKERKNRLTAEKKRKKGKNKFIYDF